MEKAGIQYRDPKVILLDFTDLGVSEIAARTCYNSFDKSENEGIKNFEKDKKLQKIDNSKLLEQLTWVHFHESILEHIVFNFYLEDFSRGVLQELARHRIASYSVRSTRYTMGDILLSFIFAKNLEDFKENLEILDANPFIIETEIFNDLLIRQLFEKLELQKQVLGFDNFIDLILSKSQKEFIKNSDELNKKLLLKVKSLPAKRNVGDNFKWIVDDNWSVNAVVTMNLRSFKNFIKLRDSGAAYFQIRELAKKMLEATPSKFISLIKKQ